MTISLRNTQALNDLASLLYDYLPNKPHPYANQCLSIKGVAHDLELDALYTEGSKLPSITTLLVNTLERQNSKFCPLIREIIKRGMIYRQNKGTPILREDVKELNEVIRQIGFKLPELWDPRFLEYLPRRNPEPAPESTLGASPEALKQIEKDSWNLTLLVLQHGDLPLKRYL